VGLDQVEFDVAGTREDQLVARLRGAATSRVA